jgi:hypothetical protein
MKTEQIGNGTARVFRAGSLDETWQTLSACNVKFLSPPKKPSWERQAILEDSFANQYDLMGK